MEAGNFRTAYSKFNEVIERNATFKEAMEHKNTCLEEGLITLALLPFSNGTAQNGLDKKVSAYALDALTRIGDPFLKVVDRENMELIISEQQLGLSGVIDEETAVNVGNLTGAETMLTGTVLNYGTHEDKLQKTTMRGFESYRVKRTNPDTKKTYYETRYRSVNYYRFQKRATVSVSFQYKIVSLETGEILDSKIIERTFEDTVVYADYSGDVTTLFPERNGRVNTNKEAKRDLENLIHGRRTIKNTTELANDLMKDVTAELSSNVENLMGQMVK